MICIRYAGAGWARAGKVQSAIQAEVKDGSLLRKSLWS